jgi:V-type H+-transporting ATPase subunit E
MRNSRRSARVQRRRRRCALSLFRHRQCPQLPDSQQSTLTNKSRLRLLHRREEHLQDLFASARAQISGLADDEARYAQFLESVIVQGLLQLLEPSVTVYARAKDEAIAERALESAKKAYYDMSGREVEVELDASLSDEL